jgi:hypothetical protein
MMGFVSDPKPTVDTPADAVMAEVQQRVREQLRAQLLAHGSASEFTDPRTFEAVDALFRRAMLQEDRHGLLIPQLFDDRWAPELSLQFGSHRSPVLASMLLFFKRRVMLPLTRWLYEYALENFKRQDRVNIALMSCLQTYAAEHARLHVRVDALEALLAKHHSAPPSTPPARS